MLKKVKRTRRHNNKRGKRFNKNIRQSRKQTKKNLHLNLNLNLHSQDGGSASYSYDNQVKNEVGNKEKFQVTTFRSINQDDLDRFKISNYVNKNIDWKGLPGPPPTDCVIM
jgi:hypothetical protein